MNQFFQYDEDGNVTAIVSSNGVPAPECARQVAVKEMPDHRKKVDTKTGRIIDTKHSTKLLPE